MKLCTFVAPVQHLFAGQRDLLELGAVALRAGNVHLVTPCRPTSVWKENLSNQLRSSLVETFQCVVNLQPCPPGLVACLHSTRPQYGHFLSHVQQQPLIYMSRFGWQTARLCRTQTLSNHPRVSFKPFILSHMQVSPSNSVRYIPNLRCQLNRRSENRP